MCVCRYSDELEWADKTIAIYLTLVVDLGDFKTCGAYSMTSGTILLTLICSKPLPYHLLCEMSQVDSPNTKRLIPPPEAPTNQTLPFPSETCPDGHFTHTFLAFDMKSSCCSWNNDKTPKTAACEKEDLNYPPPAFICTNGIEVAPFTLVCDHRHDCEDGSDEDFCHWEPCGGDKPMKCTTSRQVHSFFKFVSP